MTGREFLIGLGRRVFVFTIVIPAVFLGFLALTWSGGSSSASLGIGLGGYFFGIPLWIICASIALWRLVRERVCSIGLAPATSLIFIPFVLADWKFFLGLFRPFYAPFLIAAILLVICLALWPDEKAKLENEGPRKVSVVVLGVCVAMQTLLALVALIGSAMFVLTTMGTAFRMEHLAAFYAGKWNYALCAAIVWVLVEVRRDVVSASGLPSDTEESGSI